jgi:hypothetical protein
MVMLRKMSMLMNVNNTTVAVEMFMDEVNAQKERGIVQYFRCPTRRSNRVILSQHNGPI